MWKSMVEDFLTIKNLLDTLKGKEAKPKDISNLKWKKTNKDAITYPQAIMWQMK